MLYIHIPQAQTNNNSHCIDRFFFAYRTNQAQDYRKEGTPTHSPVSNGRKTEEGFSPRQKAGKVATVLAQNSMINEDE